MNEGKVKAVLSINSNNPCILTLKLSLILSDFPKAVLVINLYQSNGLCYNVLWRGRDIQDRIYDHHT